jgi:DNA (cytosine-5)-methyltransferase 1
MGRRDVMRLLDLFSGAGGAAMGYHRAGFEVVGVDIKPQKHYPFEFHQADALEYLREHGQEFDAIHASPPCQRYSIATKCRGQALCDSHPDLTSAVRKALIDTGRIYVIENVILAPLANVIMLCGTMFGLRVLRHRHFESNAYLWMPEHRKHPCGSLTNAHRKYLRGDSPFVCIAGHNFAREEGATAMGIDWMGSRRELSQAIPPAYTEFIGKQLVSFVVRLGTVDYRLKT